MSKSTKQTIVFPVSTWIHSLRSIGDIIIMVLKESVWGYGDGVYIITGLKKTTINRWLKAKSKGKFFHENVKHNSNVIVEHLIDENLNKACHVKWGWNETTITLS